MVQVPESCAAERAELETVLSALGRNPRLANLLKYVSERALQGRADEISEYAIATEVFARSKTSFDGSVDSIARVETHRLRKRLREYYETDGKDHAIVISVPLRSYVPEFSHRDAAVPSSSLSRITSPADLRELSADGSTTGNLQPAVETPFPQPDVPKSKAQRRPVLVYAGIVLLILLGFTIFEWLTKRAAHPEDVASSVPQNGVAPVTPTQAAHVPLRILAGYQGSPRIDSAGAYWEADRYFTGEAGFERPNTPIARTSDPMLFQHWRTGNFSYDVPLAPGTYELHLFFVASPPNEQTQYFDVSVNGQPLLKGFNISVDALGPDIADEKVFKDISPDRDGFLHLKFSSGRGAATVNAIEILPGLPHRQVPIRLVMQPAAVTDHSGNLWHSDNYFENGVLSDTPRQVSGTPDPNLYAQERYGHFTYSIPVDSRGRYTLVLHFAELYWVRDMSLSVGVGTRVFSVYCNGTTLLDHFDVFKEAGSLHAVTKTFSHLRPTPEGKLDLTFDPLVNYATISAIEVIDESS